MAASRSAIPSCTFNRRDEHCTAAVAIVLARSRRTPVFNLRHRRRHHHHHHRPSPPPLSLPQRSTRRSCFGVAARDATWRRDSVLGIEMTDDAMLRDDISRLNPPPPRPSSYFIEGGFEIVSLYLSVFRSCHAEPNRATKTDDWSERKKVRVDQ